MSKRIIGFTVQRGKLCEIVQKDNEIVVEETNTSSDE